MKIRLGRNSWHRRLSAPLVWLLVIATAFGGITVPQAFADGPSALVNESFESFSVGQTPSGWGVNATGSSSVTVQAEENGNHVLRIYDASKKATQGVFKSFTAQTGAAAVLTDIQLPAGGTSGKENILLYVNDSTGKTAVALNMTPDKILSYRTVGTTTTTQTLASGLPVGTWRQLAIAADTDAKTFDLYVNGGLAAAAVPFRYDTAVNIATLQVTGAYYGDEANYIRIANIDNVAVYSGGMPFIYAPKLTPDQIDAAVGYPIDLTFTDSETWRTAITGIFINGQTVASSVYSVTAGRIRIHESAFPTAGAYSIQVQANGYANAVVTQTIAASLYESLLDETFDSTAAGSLPAGWTSSLTGTSHAGVVDTVYDGRYLNVRDESIQSSKSVQVPLPVRRGGVVIEADLQVVPGTSGRDSVLFYVIGENNKAAVALTVSPTAINSLRTVGTSTTSTSVASGLPKGQWMSIKLAADQENRTFDVYVNGALTAQSVPFRYDDAGAFAKLQIGGSSYTEAVAYVREANVDNVKVYTGRIAIEPPPHFTPPPPGYEKNSFDHYSSVFLSSRTYRTDGKDGQIGTLDALKQFMATDDKWSYIADEGSIQKIVALGLGFQGGLNMNMGSGGRAELFDGTVAVAPWMTWGSTWGSLSDPVYYDIVLNGAKQSIDAGVRSFQFDDWLGSEAAYPWGADFSTAAMSGFRDYLQSRYDTAQLTAWGISDIGTFSYKTYLQNTLNVHTNAEYLSARPQSPLEPAFKQYLHDTTRAFHIRLKQDMGTYAGEPIEFSNNASIVRSATSSKHFLYDVFDYAMGEHSESNLALDFLVANGSIATGLGKPTVLSPIPLHESYIRQSAAAAYAMGQYMLVPWDIWIEGSVRYYGTAQQYGDIFHFIRQYPFLFDGKEVPAKVGVLLKWDELNATRFNELIMRLFEAGVPFKVLTAQSTDPLFTLDSGKFAGLEKLIAYTPVDHFAASDQAAIAASGLPVYASTAIVNDWLADNRAVKTSGMNGVYSVMRAGDGDGQTVVHVLNRNLFPVEGVELRVKTSSLPQTSPLHAVIYRPGYDPEPLTVTNSGDGELVIQLPKLNEWGIVALTPDAPDAGSTFRIEAPWSALAIGNPTAGGGVSQAGGTVTLASYGKGVGAPSYGDSGSSDQLSYAYRTLDATPRENFQVSASIQPIGTTSGAASGLMLRSTPASNAKFIAVAFKPGESPKLLWRASDNAAVQQTTLASTAASGYVQIKRNLGQYEVYISQNGIDWGQPLAAVALDFNPKLGGYFTAAGKTASAGQSHSAAFSGWSYTVESAQLPGVLAGLKLNGVPAAAEIGSLSQASVTAVVYNGGTASEIDVTHERLAWSSSNAATVRLPGGGIIYAASTGTTSIGAAMTVNGITYSASAPITVTPKPSSLLSESFDSYGAGEVPQGWTFTNAAAGNSYVEVASVPTDADRSLHVYDNAPSGFPSAAAAFETVSDSVYVRLDFRVNRGANPQTGGGIVAYVQTAGGQNAASLLVDGDGFWYLDGSTRVTVAPVVDDRWYHIDMLLNPAEKKMDLYIDNVQVVSQGNFREYVSTISKLLLGGSTSAVDSHLYWNNVSVSRADGSP